MTRKVVGYIRVSTDDQSLGPEAQRVELERWASRENAELVGVYTDQGVSGATAGESREGMATALDAVRTYGAEALIVAKRDRLARDVVEAAMIERLLDREGAVILSAAGEGTGADDPASKLMRRLVDAFAEYERELIRSRTKAALAVKKSRGELVGSVPYGSRLAADGRTLEPVPAEVETIEQARALRKAGKSLRAIATELEADGRVSRKGRRFSPTQIKRILEAA